MGHKLIFIIKKFASFASALKQRIRGQECATSVVRNKEIEDKERAWLLVSQEKAIIK